MSHGIRALVATSALLASGSAALALAHSGIRIPLLSALGPAGTRAVPPAVAAFTGAALAHLVVAVGLTRRRPWSWSLAVVVNALTLLAAAVPFRGAGSVVGILLAATALTLLSAGRVRTALLATD